MGRGRGREMKVLLTLAMTTIMTTSAYAACTAGSLDQCKTSTECDGLNGGVTPKVYAFNSDTKACVKVSGEDATTCLGVDGSAPKAKVVSGDDKANGTTSAEGKAK
jgi:hypothetical protein